MSQEKPLPSFYAKIRHSKSMWTPICTFVLMAYGSWIYGHIFCYKVVHQHLHLHKSITIGLIITEVTLYFYSIFLWWNIVHYVGPGFQEQVLPYGQIVTVGDEEANPFVCQESGVSLSDSSVCSRPPEVYLCDENGYPPWCTMCQSIKLPRTHHSSHLNKCIWKFDHYCIFIGQVIGGANYKLFMQFTTVLIIYTLIIGISVISVYLVNFNNEHLRSDNVIRGNILVLFILIIFGFLMCFMLATQHLYYMYINQTSIEIIQRKIDSKTIHRDYIAVRLDGGTGEAEDSRQRLVMETPFDTLERRYWKRNSILENFKQHLGPKVWQWVLPTRGHSQDLGFKLGEKYKELLVSNIDKTKKIKVEGDYI